MKKTTILLLSLFSIALSFSQNTKSDKMDWFREARFGMFIHWGVYAVPAGAFNGTDINGVYHENLEVPRHDMQAGSEWILKGAKIPRNTYRTYANRFTAENYDPEAIVRLAKNTGMKYIIITAKHHEGFCMFPTSISNWNVSNTPANRDLLRPLVEAAKREGLKIGFYFSQNVDWMHEGGMGEIPELNGGEYSYAKQKSYVENNVCPMIKQLLTDYDIDILWFDIPSVAKYRDLADKINNTVNQYRKDDLITNNRLSPWHGGDYETPEHSIEDIPVNGYEDGRDWERCMTLNSSWGYVDELKNSYFMWRFSKERVLELFVETISKGGNLLLNIGPDKTGNIPEKYTEYFDVIGDWMSRNSESIYNTKANPIITYNPYGFFTRKEKPSGGQTIYFHLKNKINSANLWPKDGKLLIRGIMSMPENAYFLATQENIQTEMTEDGLLLTGLPESPVETSLSVVVLDFNSEITQHKGIKQNQEGGLLMNAVEAIIPSGALIDGDPITLGFYASNMWPLDPIKTKANWQINISRPGTFLVTGEIYPQGNGNCKVKTGNSTYTFSVTKNNDNWDYHTETFGQIAIPASGIYDFEVLSEDAYINIRNIKLDFISDSSIINDKIFDPVIYKKEDNTFTLETKSLKPVDLQVFDASGKKIYSVSKAVQNITFEVPAKGVFIVEAKTDTHKKTMKIVN